MKAIKKFPLLIVLMLVLLTGCSSKSDDATTEMNVTTESVETTEITETTETTEATTEGMSESSEPSTGESMTVTGIYQGQIDNNSIEVKVGENYMAFRSLNFESLLVGIDTGDNVEIVYASNSDGQNELIEIIKK